MRHDRSSQNGIFGGTRIVTWLVTLLVLLAVRPAFSQAVTGPLRGLHLPNMPMNQNHRNAANAMAPGMVVVLSDQIDPSTVEYLRHDLPAYSPGAEIFVRYSPTTCPHSGYQKAGHSVRSPHDVAMDIINAYWLYLNTYSLELRRWIPGNEPELEWAGDPFAMQKWVDIGNYYGAIYLEVQYNKGSAPIELYTPGFTQFASVGVGNFLSDGRAIRAGIDYVAVSGQLSDDFNIYPVGYNVPQIKAMINAYQRFTWHSYWWPGKAWRQRVWQWFPPWLTDKLYNQGYPSRITEAGWMIDAVGGTGGVEGHPNRAYPDWDAYVNSEADYYGGGAWSGYYEADLRYFLDPNVCGAGGVALWFLDAHPCSGDQRFFEQAALDSNDYIRPWFSGFIRQLNGQPYSRPYSVGGRTAATNGSLLDGVSIVAAGSGRTYQATSNGNGGYFISNVPAGSYNATATKTGYAPQTVTVSVNGSGNAEASFNLQPKVVISGFNISIGPTTAFTWSTNVASTSYVYYRVYGTTTWTVVSDTNLVTTHSMTITGLSPSTIYEYQVKSTRSGYEDGIKSGTFVFASAPVPPTIERSPATLLSYCTQGSNAASQSFTVRNSGGETLSYSITDNVNWLSVTPTSGTSTGETDTITVNYTTSSLTPGTYNGTITITASGATNNPQTIAVTLTVTAPPTIAMMPTTLSRSCTQGSNAGSQAFWVWNNGGGTLSYSITDNVSWLWVAPTSGTSGWEADPITVNYSTSSLTPGTYNGTITITASGATNSPQTIPVTLTVTAPPPTITISNIYVDSITQTSARVRWTTNVASSSRVDYGTTTSYGSYAYDGTQVTSHAITLTGLSAGTTYHYKVTSTRSGYQTGVSSDKTFTTTAAGFGTLTGGVYVFTGDTIQTDGGEYSTQDRAAKPLKRIGSDAATDGHDRQAAVAPPGQGDLTPLAGATVTVAGRSAVSNALGSYTITGIPAGTYTATCQHPLYGAQSRPVTITAGGTASRVWIYYPSPDPPVW